MHVHENMFYKVNAGFRKSGHICLPGPLLAAAKSTHSEPTYLAFADSALPYSIQPSLANQEIREIPDQAIIVTTLYA